MNAARLEGVHRRFGDFPALQGMDLAVETGTMHAFLGANGAGKSTSVRCLLGLIAADSGTVELLGGRPTSESVRRVGYLPEQRGLYLEMSILEHLTFVGQMRGLSSSVAKARGSTWLERLGLGGRAADKGKSLSKGLQQKVQIAAALLHDPELIIFDEPFNGLDPMAQRELEAILQEALGRGATVLLCTHLIEHAERLASHATLVSAGRQLVQDEVDTIRREAWEGWYEVMFDGPSHWVERLAGADREAIAGGVRVRLREGGPRDLLQAALASDVEIVSYRQHLPSLRDVMLAREASP